MNKLPATITNIQQSGTIMLVDASVEGQQFSALMIESGSRPDWLFVGNSVDLIFKETEASLAKDLQGTISTRNRMKCRVLEVHKGELLSKVALQFKGFPLVAVITTRAAEALNLIVGDEIEALVKANEVSLKKK